MLHYNSCDSMRVEEYIKLLDKDGFIILPDVISETECQTFKNFLEEDYKRFSRFYDRSNEKKENELSDKSGEKVVFNLHNKNISWFNLFEHRKVISVLDKFLKSGSYNNDEPYYLNNISARCPMKGFGHQQLHLDSNIAGVNYPLIANVMWLLDDFTVDNGATRVVPGSHKWHTYAPNGENHENEIRITGSKGSVIIFNANLWHGGGENKTNESRWALVLGYARWFIKPSFEYLQNTPKSIFKQLSIEQKKLLGFNLIPPKDEFTRMRRRSSFFEEPFDYKLPQKGKNKE